MRMIDLAQGRGWGDLQVERYPTELCLYMTAFLFLYLDIDSLSNGYFLDE